MGTPHTPNEQTPPKPPRRLGMLIGAAALTLTMVGAAAFATVMLVPELMGVNPMQRTSGSEKTATLKVTGEPLGSGGSWTSGTKEVWTAQTSTMREWSELGGGDFTDVLLLYSRGWSLYDLYGDTAYDVATLDPNTGRVSWESEDAGWAHHFCSETEIDGTVSCLNAEGFQETEDYDWQWDVIDWASGDKKKSARLLDMGIEGGFGYPKIERTSEYLHLFLPMHGDYLLQTEGYFGEPDYRGVLNVRMDPTGSKTLWSTHSSGCWDISTEGIVAHRGLLLPGDGVALNAETGEDFLPEGTCAELVADGVLVVSGEGSTQLPDSVTAPDGSEIRLVKDTDHRRTFRVHGDLPPTPLRFINVRFGEDGGSRGTGELEAFDPKTGESTWSRPVTLEDFHDDRTFRGSVKYDGRHLLVSYDNQLLAMEPGSGEIAWSVPSNSPLPEIGFDGTILVGRPGPTGRNHSVALDPESGNELWTVPGTAYFAPDPEGFESVLVLGDGYVSRLIPADRTTDVPKPPADAPACPDGMTPISWTRYEGGSILLCQQDQKYVVVTPEQPRWRATELNFTSGGFEVVFGEEARVWVSLGGSLVTIEEKGDRSSSPAITSWTSARGETKFRPPSDIKTCPAGSWPISLSTFDGGWLLVCGTSSTQPTHVYFNDGQVVESDRVSFSGGAYCSDTSVGEVCVYRSPALIAVEDGSAETRQQSVSSNYFGDFGEGGAGTGTGSYGVAAPDVNAEDQVRYLTEILEKSAVGRADLNQAVSQVRSCNDVPGAIRTLQGVTENREELLEALDSTPVDAVPGGIQLVSQLRRALELSRDSDLVWVEWAQSEGANGCALGNDNPLYQKVYNMNLDVALAKDAFVDNWNQNIVPRYGAPRFTRPQI